MKKISLSIPQPCHENWQTMSQEEKGRFCSSCQKTVLDFSSMSDRQLAEFFKKPVAGVCGRFNADQLNKTLEIPRKRIPWIRYFFQFAIPAFLVSLKGQAQGKVVVTTEQAPPVKSKPKMMCDPDTTLPEKIILKGISVEDNREVIMGMVAIPFQKKKVPNTPITIIKPAVDSAMNDFTISPNPASTTGSITLGLRDQPLGDYTVEILDAAGTVMSKRPVKFTTTGQRMNIDLSLVKAGVHFVRLTHITTGKVYTERFAVMY